MNRRSFLRLAATAPAALTAQPRRPNVVLILADDLGSSDLSCYGCPDIQTPHIDSIGQKGARFTRFYSNGPECTPTRTSLLTGRYQQRVGGLECAIGVGDVGRYDDAVWLQKRGELGLPPSESTLPRMLKDAGYDTAIFGKWHLGYPQKFWPDRHGFDESFGILGGNADYFTHTEEDGRQVLFQNGKLTKRTGYLTDVIADEALGWLKNRTSAKPFCLYLPFTAPHQPIQDPGGSGGDGPTRGARPIFKKMVERMDARVGDVLKQLDTMGVTENTIVIFLSDNGADNNGRNAPLRARKSTLWEGGIRVPCLARWPANIPAGAALSQTGITMDWTPTLLAAAGVPAPTGRTFDGMNLLPVLSGGKQNTPRALFWRSKRGQRVWKCARDGDRKLVIDPDGNEELHDLGSDEIEQKNLLPQAANEAAELKRKFAAWEREVMAPRLKPFREQPG